MAYLELAKIVNTHGIHGEVKLVCNYNGKNFKNWKPDEVVYLENQGQYLALTIKTVRNHQNFLLLTFVNYNNINDVLFMKQKGLCTDKIDDTVWIQENLTDYQVIDAKTRNQIGTIKGFVENNHSGLWEVILLDDKSFYLPNNKEFIVEVDKNAKTVIANLIKGMIVNEN